MNYSEMLLWQPSAKSECIPKKVYPSSQKSEVTVSSGTCSIATAPTTVNISIYSKDKDNSLFCRIRCYVLVKLQVVTSQRTTTFQCYLLFCVVKYLGLSSYWRHKVLDVEKQVLRVMFATKGKDDIGNQTKRKCTIISFHEILLRW